MKRYIKLPTEAILNMDLSQPWQVTPFMTASLNEKSIQDVTFNEDGTEGTLSYETIEVEQPHTYSYINPATGQVETHTVQTGVIGRPQWYDANTMQEVSETELTELINSNPDWEAGVSYIVGEKCKYGGKVYMVITAHTSQADWTPDIVQALFRAVPPGQIISPWVQPTGGHDAYNKGDKVTFNGKTYESLIDGNVWSPTAYPQGWKQI